MIKTHTKVLTFFLALMIVTIVSSCQESKMERFEREAKDYTERNCPQKLDSLVTLDSMVFRNDGTMDFIYYHSVNVSPIVEEAFKTRGEELRKSYLTSIRNSIDLRNIKDAGLNIVYVYYASDSPSKVLAKFRYTKEDYQ